MTSSGAALAAGDRCDRCGAQAYLRVGLPAGGELLFCGHHAEEHRAKLEDLAAGGAELTDRLGEVARSPIARP